MRTRLAVLTAALLLAAGCGKAGVDTAPATPEEEKQAEQRIKEEAGRERKARQNEQKGKTADPRDD
jgi:hypothetical protein